MLPGPLLGSDGGPAALRSPRQQETAVVGRLHDLQHPIAHPGVCSAPRAPPTDTASVKAVRAQLDLMEQDCARVSAPDHATPFASLEDAVDRLLPFHVSRRAGMLLCRRRHPCLLLGRHRHPCLLEKRR